LETNTTYLALDEINGLQLMRLAHSWTYDTLANLLGYSKNSKQQIYETLVGDCPPTPRAVKCLSENLGISFEQAAKMFAPIKRTQLAEFAAGVLSNG
jgi:hypothetical protein